MKSNHRFVVVAGGVLASTLTLAGCDLVGESDPLAAYAPDTLCNRLVVSERMMEQLGDLANLKVGDKLTSPEVTAEEAYAEINGPMAKDIESVIAATDVNQFCEDAAALGPDASPEDLRSLFKDEYASQFPGE